MPKYVPRSTTKTSHVSAGLRPAVLARVNDLAAHQDVTRAHYLGQLLLARHADLDTVAARTSPAARGGPPLVTEAVTVGARFHDRLDASASAHQTTVSRIVASIVDEALGGRRHST